MSTDAVISGLVSKGREDVSGFFKALLDFIPYEHQETGVGPAAVQTPKKLREAISSMIFLSLNKHQVVLDTGYIRQHILEENSMILSGFEADDSRLLPLFAQAAGRLTQIKEYLVALERVMDTEGESNTPIYQNLTMIQQVLSMLERSSIRFMASTNGHLVLSGLGGGSLDSAFSVPSAVY